MIASVFTADRAEVKRLISSSPNDKMNDVEMKAMDACLLLSHEIWIGKVKGEIACVWGLCPPTLMSNQAYLWLYTNHLVEEHKFLFVRRSQRWMEEVLKDYKKIVGFCSPDNARAIRWIEWMGGKFSYNETQAVFEIKANG